MQHALQISRRIEYGTRAMVYLASLPDGITTSFREIAKKMVIPEDFLAKILKTLVKAKLVKSTRGSHGGYSLARPAKDVSFLEIIEAVEGPVAVNLCTSPTHDGCEFVGRCTMMSVWQEGQNQMVELYRKTRLDRLAMRSFRFESPVLKAIERASATPSTRR